MNTIINKIKLCTKQFYTVGKVSKDLRVCAEKAMNQYIEPKELSKMCSIFGFSKREIIEKIVVDTKILIEEEKRKKEEEEYARTHSCFNN